MCEFCETVGNHILEEGIYLDLYMNVEENDLPRIIAVESDYIDYYPKFCPECGRNLLFNRNGNYTSVVQ